MTPIRPCPSGPRTLKALTSGREGNLKGQVASGKSLARAQATNGTTTRREFLRAVSGSTKWTRRIFRSAASAARLTQSGYPKRRLSKWNRHR